MVAVNIIDFFRYLLLRPRWLDGVAYEAKRTGMTQMFYRVTPISAFIVAIDTVISHRLLIITELYVLWQRWLWLDFGCLWIRVVNPLNFIKFA